MTTKELIRAYKNGDTMGVASHLYIKDNKLINYDTIIAYKDENGGVHLNAKKYSSSTSKIQSMCRQILNIVEEYEGEDCDLWDYGAPQIRARDIY